MFGEEEGANTEYSLIPEGGYNVTFDNVTLDEDSANHPFVNCTFTIFDGDHANRKLWKRFYFSAGTAARFLPWQFGVMGIKEAIDAKGASNHVESARATMEVMGDIIGQGFTVYVEIKEGQTGSQYNDLVVKTKGHTAKATAAVVEKSAMQVAVESTLPKFDPNEEINF